MPTNYFTKTILFFAFIIVCINTLDAQEKNAGTQPKVAERHYIFTALSYSSSSGGKRQLAPDEYTVHIKNDSVIAFLPYYGASYTAQIAQTDGGIKFTSLQFDYSFTEKKKDQCEITIKPKDASGVQQLFLLVYSDGTAQLQVISTNREPTSFTGYFTVK
jgi:hypothetical protein